MIICSNCGRENEDHYKFCLGCGSQLPKPTPVAQPEPEAPRMIDCPHCSTPVPSNFKFCGACGGPIAAALGAQSSPEPVKSTMQAAPQDPEPGLGGLGSAPSVGSALAKLVVIRPDGSEGATIPLQEGELVIGRASDYPVLANDMFLSPQHASITIRDGKFLIKDLDSLNGVFYRIQGEVPLVHNDMIRLGQELMQFELMSEVQPEQASHNDETLLGGSPDIGFWGKLSLIGGPNTVTRAFLLKDDEITIGREIGDIVFRDDGFVSGRHARLSKTQGQVMFKDLNSSNGTYIRIKGERTLVDGDLILMGQQLFRLVA